MEPAENVKKFIGQAGVLVRDIIPITIPDWHKPKKAAVGDEASYVSDATKQLLWGSLLPYFNLPVGFTEGQTKKLKEWTFKKMAVQFQTWKKKLWDNYGPEGPEFTGRFEKLRALWPAFKAYRSSSDYKSRSAINVENAKKKQYFHKLGSGGYKSAIPKWKAYEAQLLENGVMPRTYDWPERSKFWLYAHGAGLDPKIGRIVAKGKWKLKIEKIAKELEDAVDKVRKGVYIPDRENDELTLALGNPEHVGRVRTLPGLTMKDAWPECADSYRSRSRTKKKCADRLSTLELRVQQLEQNLTDSTSRQRAPDQQLFIEDPQADAAPSQPKSSVGSSHLEGCGASYPVDYVTEKTECELHVPIRNMSVKVAVGYVYPQQDGATHHHQPIPADCALVGVDDIVPTYETMDLDHPGGDEEKTLGDVKRGFALWKKQYIVFSGPVPRPPTPRGRSPHVQQSPHEPQGPSTTPAGSPHELQGPSSPRGSSPHEQQSPQLPEGGPSASPPPRLPPRKRAPVKRNGSDRKSVV